MPKVTCIEYIYIYIYIYYKGSLHILFKRFSCIVFFARWAGIVIWRVPIAYMLNCTIQHRRFRSFGANLKCCGEEVHTEVHIAALTNARADVPDVVHMLTFVPLLAYRVVSWPTNPFIHFPNVVSVQSFNLKSAFSYSFVPLSLYPVAPSVYNVTRLATCLLIWLVAIIVFQYILKSLPTCIYFSASVLSSSLNNVNHFYFPVRTLLRSGFSVTSLLQCLFVSFLLDVFAWKRPLSLCYWDVPKEALKLWIFLRNVAWLGSAQVGFQLEDLFWTCREPVLSLLLRAKLLWLLLK